jgi:hypothetical protein
MLTYWTLLRNNNSIQLTNDTSKNIVSTKKNEICIKMVNTPPILKNCLKIFLLGGPHSKFPKN